MQTWSIMRVAKEKLMTSKKRTPPKSATGIGKPGTSPPKKTNDDNPILEAALKYQAMGLSVIPIRPGDKRPDLRSWKKYQSQPADRATVRRWFRDDPDLSIAIILGKVSGGLVVADFDDMKAYEAWKEAFPELAAMLPTVKSGKGCHVYFRSPNAKYGKLKDWSGQCDGNPGELLADRRYVIVPPSKHASGKLYTWITPLPDDINDIPKLGAVKSGFTSPQPRKKKTAANPRYGKDDDVNGFCFLRTRKFLDCGAPKTSRNNELYHAASNLASLGYSFEDARALLLKSCQKCSPPYKGKKEDREIEATIESGFNNPRHCAKADFRYMPPIPLEIVAMPGLSDSAKLIWGIIEWHLRTNDFAHPSVGRIAKMIGRNEGTVRKGLRKLEELGLIETRSRLNKTSLYATNLPPIDLDETEISSQTPQEMWRQIYTSYVFPYLETESEPV